MSSSAKTQMKPPFGANLDQEVTGLPPKTLRSIAAFFTHLQNLAQCHKRSDFPFDDQFSGNASKQPSAGSLALADPFAPIRLRDLGRRLIAAAAAQVLLLQTRTQEAQSLTLINNWPTAERLWLALEADCRTPLYELNLLENLWEIKPASLRVDGASIERHRQKFVLIQLYIKMLLAGRDSLLDVSNALETDLGCWLAQFARILQRLDYESQP